MNKGAATPLSGATAPLTCYCMISTITFFSSFEAAAFTTERIALAMRPCLPDYLAHVGLRNAQFKHDGFLILCLCYDDLIRIIDE